MPIIGPMLTKTATEFYGTQEILAQTLGLSQSTVAGWGEYPPEIQQVKLEKLTRGKLKAEKSCYLPKPRTDNARDRVA